MHSVRRPGRIGWPGKLAGDKGYSYDSTRQFIKDCGIEPVIPRKSNQKRSKGERFDKKAYCKRSRVEQAVGSLKECRRLGTRHEKLGLNFLGFVKLGIMLQYLKVLIH